MAAYVTTLPFSRRGRVKPGMTTESAGCSVTYPLPSTAAHAFGKSASVSGGAGGDVLGL
jgi:hypothetical protein